MNKELFERAILGYISVRQQYYKIEEGLYGQIIDEGRFSDNLYLIEESLLESYIGPSFLSDYVQEACCNYINDCINNKEIFNINTLNALAGEALDEEAKETIIN